MIRTPQTKALIAVGILLFLAGKARSQISLLTRPVSGGVEMSEVSEWGGFVQNFFRATGVFPDYSAFMALPRPGSTGSYSGSALASKGLVRGSIGMSPSYGLNLRGASNAGSSMEIFADVVPESKVLLKFNADMSINWIGSNMDNRVSFTFDALAGEDKSDGLNRNSVPLIVNGGISRSTLCASAVSPPASSKYEVGGKIYYKIGTISLNGVGGIDSPDNIELLAGYNAEVTALNAYYMGDALTIHDGNVQTRLVDSLLPQSLSVKVSDGETGVAVPGAVPITFTIVEPSNGAKFSNGQTTMGVDTVNGIAGASLTLGNSPGTYTVKATCPPDVCTSGAKEVVFTAAAIQNYTDVTGVVPDGCSQVAIGSISALVDPVAHTFRLYNVPLTMNSPLFLSPPELDVICNNDAECPVENAQRMPDECAQGNFNAPRFGGKNHAGIDLPMEDGVSILSATRGNVVFIGQFVAKSPENKSWGTIVIIQSARRINDEYEMIMYAHLDPTKLRVRVGDPVGVGQEIAIASIEGATGNIREVLDGDPNTKPPTAAKPRCLHVHVERRLLNEPMTTIGFPVPCAIKSKEFMGSCDNSDMYTNGNNRVFWQAKPTDPDAEIGCGVYR